MEDTALFYATDGFGAAQKLLLDLLSVVDELAPARPATGTAGGTPITAPHEYIPNGPMETAPYLGYRPPEVRQEAFGAVLDGVETEEGHDDRDSAMTRTRARTAARTMTGTRSSGSRP